MTINVINDKAPVAPPTLDLIYLPILGFSLPMELGLSGFAPLEGTMKILASLPL